MNFFCIILLLYYTYSIFILFIILNMILKYDNRPFVYSVRELIRTRYRESIVLKSRSLMTSNIFDTMIFLIQELKLKTKAKYIKNS